MHSYIHSPILHLLAGILISVAIAAPAAASDVVVNEGVSAPGPAHHDDFYEDYLDFRLIAASYPGVDKITLNYSGPNGFSANSQVDFRVKKAGMAAVAIVDKVAGGEHLGFVFGLGAFARGSENEQKDNPSTVLKMGAVGGELSLGLSLQPVHWFTIEGTVDGGIGVARIKVEQPNQRYESDNSTYASVGAKVGAYFSIEHILLGALVGYASHGTDADLGNVNGFGADKTEIRGQGGYAGVVLGVRF